MKAQVQHRSAARLVRLEPPGDRPGRVEVAAVEEPQAGLAQFADRPGPEQGAHLDDRRRVAGHQPDL